MRKATLYSALRRVQLPEWLPPAPAACLLPEWLPSVPSAVLRVVFLFFVTFHQRKRGKCAYFFVQKGGGIRIAAPMSKGPRPPLVRIAEGFERGGIKNRENHANKRGGYHGEYLSALYK